MTIQHDHAATRRQILRGGLVIAGGVIAVSARAQEKIQQSQVQYQQTPNKGQKCSTCVNFIAPSSCQIVSGTIHSEGWCIAYAPTADAAKG
jgi:High potential iron-sulfur protein